jgi:hypothetical protein
VVNPTHIIRKGEKIKLMKDQVQTLQDGDTISLLADGNIA